MEQNLTLAEMCLEIFGRENWEYSSVVNMDSVISTTEKDA